jgi:hypothetical protein
VTPPGNVLRAYSTWAITIGVSSFMNFALGAACGEAPMSC